MIRRAVFAMLSAAACAGAVADGAVPLSDDAMKEKIFSFVTLPSRLCGRATLDFWDELKSRKITNRSWFDGDTNRLARLICELAQTNDSRIATMMIMALGEYGTPAQLPFLYSCATNAVLAKTAVKSVLHAEGVKVQRVFGVANANQRRAATDALASALIEGCRIGKAVVVPDVIEVEALDARIKPAKWHVANGSGPVLASQGQSANFVIVTRTTIEKVYTHLIAV